MALEISSTLLARLLEEAAAAPSLEICGLLFGTPERVTHALLCRNVAPDPRVAFEIDPAQLIAAHRAERSGGPRIIGCYHSHPGGLPVASARDAAAASPDGGIWLVIAGRETAFYRAVENGVLEGRFDPVTYIVTPD